MRDVIEIQGRSIGEGAPCYIIAELSANHNQNYDVAVKMIEAAHEAGADAIKLQTYTADTLTIASDQPSFKIQGGTLWDGKTLHELYQQAYTPWDWQPKLKQVADDLGIHLFSTPFDDSAVDFLENMNVPAHKIASFEMNDLELLRKIASTGKPIIMSTGMANLEEIEESVATLKEAGCQQLALLKCTSAYPAPPEEMNLKTIPDLRERFHIPIGLSDHTLGIAVASASVALGASVIEKHFTLSREEPSADSAFSLEPQEFKAMVEAVRMTEKAMGSVDYTLGDKQEKSRAFRRSLFVVEDVAKGESFNRENVRCIRPGYGLAPKNLPQVLGKKASQDIVRGTPLNWDLME